MAELEDAVQAPIPPGDDQATQNLQSVYDIAKKKLDLGSFDDFKTNLDNPEVVKGLYNHITKVEKYNVGSLKEFTDQTKTDLASTRVKPDDAKNTFMGAAQGTTKGVNGTNPSMLTPKGNQSYQTDDQKLSDKLNSQTAGYNSLNKISQPTTPIKASMRASNVPSIASHVLTSVDLNVIRPLARAATDMTAGTLHGITQLTKDGINYVTGGLAGTDKTDIFSDAQDYVDKKMPSGESGSAATDILRSAVQTVPLVLSTLVGGEVTQVPKALSFIGSIGGADMAMAIPRLLKMSGILAGVSGFSAYGSSRTNGQDIGTSAKNAGIAGLKGAASGATMEAQSYLGGQLGGKLVSKLENMGLIQEGKLLPSAIRAMSTMSVFGAGSATEDIAQGKPIDWHNVAVNMGVGAAFELPGLAHSATEDLTNLFKAKQASRIVSLLKATPEQIDAINGLKTDPTDIQAHAIKLAVDAGNSDSADESNVKIAAATALQNTADIKGISHDIVDNHQEVLDTIDKSDLEPEEKQALSQKVTDIAETQNPIAIKQHELSTNIQQSQPQIDELTKSISSEQNPIEKAKLQVQLEEIKDKQTSDSKSLFNITKGHKSGDITHDSGEIIGADKENNYEPMTKGSKVKYVGDDGLPTEGEIKGKDKAGSHVIEGKDGDFVVRPKDQVGDEYVNGKIKEAQDKQSASVDKSSPASDVEAKAEQKKSETPEEQAKPEDQKKLEAVDSNSTEKQVVLNNSTGDSNPKEYVSMEDSKKMFHDTVKGFRGEAKKILTRYKTALENKVNTLEKALGRQATKFTDKIARKDNAHEADINKLKNKGEQKDAKVARQNDIIITDMSDKIHSLEETVSSTQQEYESKIGRDAKNNAETISHITKQHQDYESEVHKVHEDMVKAKAELLKNVTDLTDKIGKDAPANVKKLIPEIAKVVSSVHDEKSMGKAIEKITKRIDEIYKNEGEQAALKASKKLSETAKKFAKVDPSVSEALKKLSDLGKTPDLLSDPHGYAELVTGKSNKPKSESQDELGKSETKDIKLQQGVLDDKGNLTASTYNINKYVEGELRHADQVKTERAIESIQKSMDEMRDADAKDGRESIPEDVTARDLFLDPNEYNIYFGEETTPETKKEVESKPNITEVLTKMIKSAQEMMKQGYDELTKDQKIALDALRNIDTTNIKDPKDLRLINFAIHNVIMNGKDALLNGTDAMVQYHLHNLDQDILEPARKAAEKQFWNWNIAIAKIKETMGVKTADGNLFYMRKSKLTARQTFKALNSNKTYSRLLHQIFNEPFQRAIEKASVRIQQLYKPIRERNIKLGITPEDGLRVGIYNTLRQFNYSSNLDGNAQFEAYKGIIRKSMLLMEESLDVDNIFRQGNEWVKQFKLLKSSGLYDLFINRHEDIKPENFGEVLGISDKHKELIRQFDEAHESNKPLILRTYQKYGVKPDDIENYTHMDYIASGPEKRTQGLANKDLLSEAEGQFSQSEGMTSLGRHTVSREKIPTLPGDDEPTHFLNMDAMSSFEQGINKHLMTAFTISERSRLQANLADDRVNKLFDGNMENAKKGNSNTAHIRELIKQNVGDALGTSGKSQNSRHTFMDGLSLLAMATKAPRNIFYKATLGSVLQYPKQYLESFMSAAPIIGNAAAHFYGSRFKALNKDNGYDILRQKWIENGNQLISRFGDLEAEHNQHMADAYAHTKTGYAGMITNTAKDWFKSFSDHTMNPLKYGDASISIDTWTSGYISHKMSTGQFKSPHEFNAEYLKTHDLDPDASSYADGLVEQTNAQVQKPFMASVLKFDSTERLGEFKQFLSRFQTFQIHANMEARIAIRDMFHSLSDGKDWRVLTGYFASQAASGAFKTYLANTAFNVLGNALVYGVMGANSFNKLKAQQFADDVKRGLFVKKDKDGKYIYDKIGHKVLTQKEFTPAQKWTGLGIDNTRQLLNFGLQFGETLLIGSQNMIFQSSVEWTGDKIYQNKIIKSLNDPDEIASMPKTIFHSTDNIVGYGTYAKLLDLGVFSYTGGDGHKSLYDQMGEVATQKDKNMLLYSQLATTTGGLFLGADAGSILQRYNNGIQKIMTAAYRKLPDSYGVAKKLSEVTGISIQTAASKMKNTNFTTYSGDHINIYTDKNLIPKVDEVYSKDLSVRLTKLNVMNNLKGKTQNDVEKIVHAAEKDSYSYALNKVLYSKYPGFKEEHKTSIKRDEPVAQEEPPQ